MIKNNDLNFLRKIYYIVILLVIWIYTLSITWNILIPIIIAWFLAIWIISLSNLYKLFKIPSIISLLLSLWTIVLVFYVLWTILSNNINSILSDLPTYELIVKTKISNFFYYFWISNIDFVNDYIKNIDLATLVNKLFTAFTWILSNIWLISFFIFSNINTSNNLKYYRTSFLVK